MPALEGFENLLSPAPGSLTPPAPSPSCHPLAGSCQWLYPSKRAVSCPFLCWRRVKNSLLLPITIPCLSQECSQPCSCSRCQSPGIQLVNVFITFVNSAEIKPFTELNVVTANPLETVTWALHSEKRLCCSG